MFHSDKLSCNYVTTKQLRSGCQGSSQILPAWRLFTSPPFSSIYTRAMLSDVSEMIAAWTKCREPCLQGYPDKHPPGSRNELSQHAARWKRGSSRLAGWDLRAPCGAVPVLLYVRTELTNKYLPTQQIRPGSVLGAGDCFFLRRLSHERGASPV